MPSEPAQATAALCRREEPRSSSPQVASPSRRALLLGMSTAGAAVAAVAGSTTQASAGTGDPVLHLVRRATYGPTPALVAEVRSSGIQPWLDAQLAPASIPDPEVDALMTRWPRRDLRIWEAREQLTTTERWGFAYEVAERHLARALWSRRQLLEVMADFWANHLVVPAPTSDAWDSAHLYHRDVIRKHALGRFTDLLAAAVQSPALLTVLDNADSTRQAPNENHGRELLELHTVGAGAYSEADVKAAARVLSGLSIDKESGLFEFKPWRHWVGPVKVMGWSHENSTAEDGLAVALSMLSYLATHPLTARRIATKLAVRFVADSPPAALVDRLAGVYLSAGTAIAPVLKALFTSAEFGASTSQKVRTPYEDAVATMRVLEARPPASGTSVLREFLYLLGRMGQAPLGWPAPNGYPDVAAAWASASSTLQRWNFHLGAVHGTTFAALPRLAPAALLPSPLPTTFGAYVDALAARLLIDPLTAEQRQAVCTFLLHAPADPLPPDRQRVRLPLALRDLPAARHPQLRVPLRSPVTRPTSPDPIRSGDDCGDPGCTGGARGRAVTRRGFLGRVGAAGAAGAVASVVGPASATKLAFAADYVGDTVVVLSLRGGFDGLSAVIPVGDPAYTKLRPTIGVPASRTKQLDTMFGLHPALAPLFPLYSAGSLAFVQAVGQTARTRSHFAAMEEMENAAPGSTLRTGWIDRMIGVTGSPATFSAVHVGAGGAPRSLAGPNPELVLSDLASTKISGPGAAAEQERWTTALKALHANAPDAVRAPALATVAVSAAAGQIATAYPTPAAAGYPDTPLAKSLKEVARLVKAKAGLRAATIDVGDWDMHSGLGASDKGWMFDQLTALSKALVAFVTDLGDRLADVTLVTLSEFGRRAAENGSGGVDHGHGNACLVLGGGVVGGKVYGTWPGLGADQLDEGDLAGTTDYRTILAEVLEKRGKLASAEVFPQLGSERLGMLRQRP